MNDDIPLELQDFNFAEVGNNQQNIWRLRDELNATRRWLRENTVSEEEELDDFTMQQVTNILPTLREGVVMTKNGRFMLAGKFIPASEAYEA